MLATATEKWKIPDEDQLKQLWSYTLESGHIRNLSSTDRYQWKAVVYSRIWSSLEESMLPLHGKRNQVTYLAKLSYHLEMVYGDYIYLIRSQTFNFHYCLTLKSDPLRITNQVQVNGSSSQFLIIISNN